MVQVSPPGLWGVLGPHPTLLLPLSQLVGWGLEVGASLLSEGGDWFAKWLPCDLQLTTGSPPVLSFAGRHEAGGR